MTDTTEAAIPALYDARKTKESPAQAKATSQIIWDAIVDIYNQEQIVTRQTLKEATGLKMTVIDDHVGRMVDNEHLRRVQDGVFVPIPRFEPPRPVYGSVTTDGFFVLEVGDKVVVMQPREARLAGALLAGQFAQFSNIQSGHDLNVLLNTVYAELKQLKRDLGAE